MYPFTDEQLRQENEFQIATNAARWALLDFRAAYLTFLAMVGMSLSGCAIAPNTVRTEVRHLSHVSQHFGDHPTNLGAETVNVIARWQRGGAYVDLGEGYNLSRGYGVQPGLPCPGGVCGPREEFTASIGYIWQVKPQH